MDGNFDQYKGKRIGVSGGFDPIHIGHLDMIEGAREIVGPEGMVMVFVNPDNFLEAKKGKAFMPLSERIRLLEALTDVDEVYAVIDTDQKTVRETLRNYQPDIFANGGDRNQSNIPEKDVCEELGIIMLFGVGGDKVQSSSELLSGYTNV